MFELEPKANTEMEAWQTEQEMYLPELFNIAAVLKYKLEFTPKDRRPAEAKIVDMLLSNNDFANASVSKLMRNALSRSPEALTELVESTNKELVRRGAHIRLKLTLDLEREVVKRYTTDDLLRFHLKVRRAIVEVVDSKPENRLIGEGKVLLYADINPPGTQRKLTSK